MSSIRFLAAWALVVLALAAPAWAQAPAVDATNTYFDTSGTTSRTANLPTGSGGHLVAFVCVDWDTATTYSLNGSSATWTEHANSPFDVSGTAARLVVYERASTGTDGLIFDTSANEKAGIAIYRVSGSDGALETVSTGATGSSLTPDSASLSPAGGSDDYRWFSAACVDSGSSLGGWTGPTGYDGVVAAEATGGGSVDMVVDSDDPAGSQASEDPGSFTATGSGQQWVAITAALAPSAAGPTGPSLGSRSRRGYGR